MKIIKKLIVVAIVAVLLYNKVLEEGISIPLSSEENQSQDDILLAAFNNKKSDLQVQGKGIVVKTLADDLKGSRHQKFIVKFTTGQTVVIAHNIDLAPKINSLRNGDSIEFYGEYEYNSRGGVIHWTHHDPKGRHVSGWLKHNDKTYQ